MEIERERERGGGVVVRGGRLQDVSKEYVLRLGYAHCLNKFETAVNRSYRLRYNLLALPPFPCSLRSSNADLSCYRQGQSTGVITVRQRQTINHSLAPAPARTNLHSDKRARQHQRIQCTKALRLRARLHA